VKFAARWILTLEPIALFIVVAAFWSPSTERLHSLWLIVPLLATRLIVYGRLIPASPLNGLMLVFLALCALNVLVAPFTWGWWILGRPVMGMALATSFADRAKRNGWQAVDGLLMASAVLALLLGIVALVWSQWTVKSVQLQGLISLLPPVPEHEFFQSVFGGGFNVNEIGGAMAWITPFVAAVAIADWRTPNPTNKVVFRRFLSTFAFCVLEVALILGQSRLAIAGVLLSLGGVIYLTIPRGVGRRLAFAALAVVTVFEIVLVTQVTNPAAEVLLERDEGSLNSRLLIWSAGAEMIVDYPLTGVGMNQYRARGVRAIYPVEGYESRILPHAHNEWVQVGADLGVPGIIVFTGWYAVGGWMLLRVWRKRHFADWITSAGIIAVGVGAGLAAHAIFALGDAITLFDRFTFLFWWLIGLVMALDIAVRESLAKDIVGKNSVAKNNAVKENRLNVSTAMLFIENEIIEKVLLFTKFRCDVGLRKLRSLTNIVRGKLPLP
jgi:O-antigen ligase